MRQAAYIGLFVYPNVNLPNDSLPSESHFREKTFYRISKFHQFCKQSLTQLVSIRTYHPITYFQTESNRAAIFLFLVSTQKRA